MTAAESGMLVIAKVNGLTFTLPSATVVGKGVHYLFVLGGAAVATSGNSIRIRPAAADTIFGGEVSGATDSENLILTGANDDEGDHVEVTCDGADWYVTRSAGTWTRGAAT